MSSPHHTSYSHPRVHFLVGLIILSGIFSLCCYLKDLPILPPGPAVAISEVTKSLWESGSLTPQYFADTYRDAQEYSRGRATMVWQDVFAIGKGGELLPKHSILSAVVAVPFYALFGNLGFWIVQQLFLVWLAFATYLIIERNSPQKIPWSTLLGITLCTQTLFYTYDLSYDLQGCALLIGGFALLRGSPFWGGVIMTLSLFVRPANILLLIPLAFVTEPGAERCIKARGLGILCGVLLLLISNYLLWGSPFLTSYARLPSFLDGAMVMTPHPVGFDLNVLISDWSEKLFGLKGVLTYNPALFAAPLVLWLLTKQEERVFHYQCLAIALGYSLYIFSYPMWGETMYGNRFLFPAIYLYLFSFVPFLGRVELWIRGR